jgi:hypothetical protein
MVLTELSHLISFLELVVGINLITQSKVPSTTLRIYRLGLFYKTHITTEVLIRFQTHN